MPSATARWSTRPGSWPPRSAKAGPDGQPSVALARFSAALLEASVPGGPRRPRPPWPWTGPTWRALPARPCPMCAPASMPKRPGATAGAMRRGKRTSFSLAITSRPPPWSMTRAGPAVPELVRRATLSSCRVDPVPAFVPALADMAASGVALGDVLADSGYAHRVAEHWALPLRALGAEIVTDLHPADRGPRGTFAGAICSNGNLYCPATPPGLLGLVPLARDASAPEIAVHDQRSADLAHYKLARLGADDQDGYHRVACPGVMGKLRCPRRAASMTLVA